MRRAHTGYFLAGASSSTTLIIAALGFFSSSGGLIPAFLTVLASSVAVGSILFMEMRRSRLAARETEKLARHLEDVLSRGNKNADYFDSIFGPADGVGGFRIEVKESAAMRLVGNIARIQQEASSLLPNSPRRGFLAMRSELYESGFWSDEEVRRFDEALQIRNAIVHGDFEKVSDSKVESASKSTDDLLSGLRSMRANSMEFGT